MIITKLVSFKPLKTGEVTVYLDKGINLHSLVDMSGHEIIIDLAEGRSETDDKLALLRNIRQSLENVGNQLAEALDEFKTLNAATKKEDL